MGFRGRYKNKRDANEGQVVATLRAHGLSVVPMDTPVDLLCGYGGQTWAVEVKDGQKPLTAAQIAFYEEWRGNHTIIRSVDDAEAFAREVRQANMTDQKSEKETWQSIGALARALAEKSGGNK